jgi:phosphoglycerate dehydrogenase-like enzyme
MKIVVTSPSFSKTNLLRDELTAIFPECAFNENGTKLHGDELITYIRNARGLIVGLENLTRDVLAECPNLQIISKYGVGLDNVDKDYCAERNIHIGWTPGVNSNSVAEMVIAFMIMLLRNLYITSNLLKDGIWNKIGGYDLSGKTVGIIGVGNIGKELVRLLNPFNCRILVNDITDQTEYYKNYGLTETPKEYIFRNSDIVTIHTPLTDKTRDMIDRDTLSLMKKNAFLINTARGSIVFKDDLKWALKNNIIAGAALDVYDDEPPTDKEFLSLPNLICTPHIGGNSYESILAMGRTAIRHLVQFFMGDEKY